MGINFSSLFLIFQEGIQFLTPHCHEINSSVDYDSEENSEIKTKITM